MANQNTAIAQKKQQLQSVITGPTMRGMVLAACGSKEVANQFTASLLELYTSDGYLQKCDPQKVALEAVKAATLKLPLTKALGYAYVVPYGTTPTFIIGYRGLVQLALRSGQYKALNADCVYEGEDITFNRLSGTLEISGQRTSDKAVGYFAYYKLLNGFEKTFYMTVDQIEAYAKKYSKAYKNGPWQTDFDAMAKKTVMRQLLKWGPANTEMAEAETYEIKAAEAAAQTEIRQNANSGSYLDDPQGIPGTVEADLDTGRIIGEAGNAEAAPADEEPDF